MDSKTNLWTHLTKDCQLRDLLTLHSMADDDDDTAAAWDAGGVQAFSQWEEVDCAVPSDQTTHQCCWLETSVATKLFTTKRLRSLS